jgi:hypothetical protein
VESFVHIDSFPICSFLVTWHLYQQLLWEGSQKSSLSHSHGQIIIPSCRCLGCQATLSLAGYLPAYIPYVPNIDDRFPASENTISKRWCHWIPICKYTERHRLLSRGVRADLGRCVRTLPPLFVCRSSVYDTREAVDCQLFFSQFVCVLSDVVLHPLCVISLTSNDKTIILKNDSFNP